MKAFAKRMRVLSVAVAMALVCAVMPLLSRVFSGGGTTLTASAAGNTVEAYTIKNVTKNKTLNVDEKNFERVANYIVYYDSVWGATHDGKASPSQWGTEVKVELREGKFVVTEIKINQQEGLEIPAEGQGYVLSGNGTGATALQEFELDDEIEFTDTSKFITINRTRGLEVLLNDKNVGPDQGNCATVWKYAPHRTKTASAAWRNRVICEKAEGENLYKVKEKQPQNAGAVFAEIPEGGIVIDTNGDEYASYGNSFYYGTQVDDIIYFVDKNPAPTLDPANITVKSGDFELEADGINPTFEHELGGYSLIYTNKANSYTTVARADETVKEYVVEKKDGVWKVTAVNDEGETVIPDYDGFVLSVPSTVTGYDSLAVGDTVTLEGTFDQKTAFAANVTTNKRVFIDAANVKRDADQIILYDDLEYLCPETQEGFDEPEVGYTGTNQWGVELKVEWQTDTEKYVVTEKTSNGTPGNMKIPENGFVLSGNGAGATALDVFGVGDEVYVFDKSIQSNTALKSILVNGKELDYFSSATLDYNVIVADDATEVPVVTYELQTRMGQAPTAKVNPITTAKGTVTIEVTAPDGTTTATYSVKFDRAYGTDARLTSIQIGDVTLGDKEIKANMTYSVKPGELPTVTATPVDARATVTVTQATAENKIATVTVVADDTTVTPRTFKITFVEVDTSLTSITVGGEALEGFSANKLEYTYKLSAGAKEAPVVAATAADSNATVSVEQAKDVAGKAAITVTIDNVVTVYTVQFEVAKGSNAGAIAGIVIGGIVVAAAAGVAMFFVLEKRGKKK